MALETLLNRASKEDTMSKEEFVLFANEQIALLTEKIEDDKHAPSDPNDDVSRGKLLVYQALEKGVSNEKLSNQELGVVGAINDILQNVGLLDGKTTLPALISKGS